MKQRTRHALLGVALLSCITAGAVIDATPAEAKSFSAGRSFSSPSRSYSAPKPRPVVVKKTVVNRTTVVQQNVHQAAPASSGGGFVSSMAGAAAGAAVTNMLMNSDNQSAPIEAAESIKQVIQCVNAEQQIVACPQAVQEAVK